MPLTLNEGSPPASSEVISTARFDREAHVSADRQNVTHRAMGWSTDYKPDELLRWIGLYERLAADPGMPRAQADVEVLHKARDLLSRGS